ncbi:DeoR/GlpR family DNA-binding transcription regulator [Nocardioides sp. YIM 152315]|uniref:DeoR/GlpR family DNA-binding transcription regulator n=1 Tax=Nocardioides sp. YIM 152315 TaxID=3031760 RepID=UPI0023DA18AD|nr:DeoR/GlpR family DNA-binding transcription regulator [Nocardioides sp. YIM 152315]MDF1605777.1 DeoR/GlpR family DNA-binding transcription regulator [Nocardioides sp. YIM 152315]
MRYTDAPARRQELLDRLAAAGYVASADVAAALGVSEMTIRRDLRRLADDGLARRVPGGASLPDARGPEPFETRSGSARPAKRALAEVAAALLTESSTVALDAGTTVAEIVDLVPEGVGVVTHSLPVITACAAAGGREVVALGGFYEPTTRSFTGPATWNAVRELTVDVAVLSCSALDDRGVYSANPVDAEIKRALIEVADRVVVLADRHKVGARAAVRFAAPEAVHVVVTDADQELTAYAEVVRVDA